MPYDHTNKLYNKLLYKYCFNCPLCQCHEIKLFCFGRASLTQAESIRYHADICHKGKETEETEEKVKRK